MAAIANTRRRAVDAPEAQLAKKSRPSEARISPVKLEAPPAEGKDLQPFALEIPCSWSASQFPFASTLIERLLNEQANVVGKTEVIVTTLTGGVVPLQVSLDDCGGAIKLRILRAQGIPVDQQRLLYKSKELPNATCLRRFIPAADLAEGKPINLHLVLKLRGGMHHATSGRFDFNDGGAVTAVLHVDAETFVPLKLHEQMSCTDFNEAVIDAVIDYIEKHAACRHDADEALQVFVCNAKLTWRGKVLMRDRNHKLLIRELGINKSVPHAERILGITRAPVSCD